MAQERSDYFSYLLRLWRVQEGDQAVWRASVQHAGTGERNSFRTLDELFAFLRRQTSAASGSDGDSDANTGQGAPQARALS